MDSGPLGEANPFNQADCGIEGVFAERDSVSRDTTLGG